MQQKKKYDEGVETFYLGGELGYGSNFFLWENLLLYAFLSLIIHKFIKVIFTYEIPNSSTCK